MTKTDPRRPRRLDFEKEVLPDLLRVLRKQIEVLESTAGVFQDGQALVPLPTDEELARMRRREISLTREAYLIGLYQRALVAAEDLASDLRTGIEGDTLKNVHKIQLSSLELNLIQAGIERLRG